MAMTLVHWVSDILIISGLVILSIAIYGIIRMPDTYTRLHAASKAALLGVIPFLIAAATTGEPAIIFRVILIGVFLVLTTPVSAHAVGHAAYLNQERMATPGAVDESGRDVPEE